MLWVRAAFELFDVGVALVSQFLMNADLRGVVTVNRQVLDRFEEALFNRLRFVFVLADVGQQRDLLFGSRAIESLGELGLTHLIHRGQSIAPQRFGLFGRFAHHQINEGGHVSGFRAGRVIVSGNNQF